MLAMAASSQCPKSRGPILACPLSLSLSLSLSPVSLSPSRSRPTAAGCGFGESPASDVGAPSGGVRFAPVLRSSPSLVEPAPG